MSDGAFNDGKLNLKLPLPIKGMVAFSAIVQK